MTVKQPNCPSRGPANYFDLVIIGAGPAGMEAAISASDVGLAVLLVDQAPLPGGQIYRNLEQASPAQTKVLGGSYKAGIGLLKRFRGCQCTYWPLAQVWQVQRLKEQDPNREEYAYEIALLRKQNSCSVFAKQLLLANGAMERPMPIKGWQLPGVMTAGAGQILLKSAALGPERVVLAGSGPLLLLLAQQYQRAGVDVAAILDTTPKANYAKALVWLWVGLLIPKQFLQGLWLTMRLLFRSNYYSAVTGIEALADSGEQGNCATPMHLAQVRFKQAAGWQTIDTTSLQLHQGLLPQTQMAQLLGLPLQWQTAQQIWQVGANKAHAKVHVAGDGGQIGGAYIARLKGRLAALQVVQAASGKSLKRTLQIKCLQVNLARLGLARKLVDKLYAPAPWLSEPHASTTLCRCEAVSAGTIRAIAEQGCIGVNQMKAFTRAGMGPCQGRQCGLAIAQVLAHSQGLPLSDIEPLRPRPPLVPVTLGQLAAHQRNP